MKSKLRAAVLAVGLALTVGLSGCQGDVEEQAAQRTGGDPHRGSLVVRKYGCATCHTIPGIAGADGLVGPSLDRIGSRVHLAGRLPNTPENMMRWIRDPQGIAPGTAMPNLGVSEQDTRDIAAYLYTLR
jgi:cytochrome c2